MILPENPDQGEIFLFHSNWLLTVTCSNNKLQRRFFSM